MKNLGIASIVLFFSAKILSPGREIKKDYGLVDTSYELRDTRYEQRATSYSMRYKITPVPADECTVGCLAVV